MPFKESYRQAYKSAMDLPKLGLHLSCPKCQTEIRSEDININKTIAKCHSCSAVFSFEENASVSQRSKPERMMPENFEVIEMEDDLSIFYKWRHTRKINSSLTLFTIIWNAALVPFILAAIASSSLIMLLMISLHLLVGLGLLTNLILSLVNSTYILVESDLITIEHQPFALPFIAKNKYINSDQLDQLYVKKYSTGTTNGVHHYAYKIEAILDNGEIVEIIKGFTNKYKAEYIEQEIEVFLNIKDQQIA